MIFGETYISYPMIFSIIALANMVSDVTGPNGTMLAMTGKEKWELFNGLLYFAVYIIASFLFSFDGIYGLCIALLLSQIVVNIAKFIEVGLLYKTIPLDLKTILAQILMIVVNGAIIYLTSFINILWLWFVIGVFVGIGLVVANCFVLSLKGTKDYKRFLSLKL